jgi:hypothetical protein
MRSSLGDHFMRYRLAVTIPPAAAQRLIQRSGVTKARRLSLNQR